MLQKKPRRWRRRLIIAAIAAAALFWVFGGWRGPEPVDDGSYVLLDLGGVFEERAPDQIVSMISGETATSLFDLLLLIRDAGEDERVAGMVVRISSMNLGWAKAQELRNALLGFRRDGKELVAYLECEFGGSTLEYYIASAAERIFAAPAASPLVSGLVGQYLFLGGLWEKLDVDMQVVKIREYKTAGDMLVNKEMSAAHREMADSLLDSIYGQLVRGVAEQRGMTEADVRAAFDDSPATAGALTDAGLADGARFLDEIEAELLGEDGEFLGAADYAGRRKPFEGELAGRVAVVFGLGQIMTGSSADSLFGDEATVGADTMSEVFAEIAEDEEVDAVVFRIDSPGGSALASDIIWRATQRIQKIKPVIVSMSDVAGSGGYYVAAGANRIVAQPGTFTGSIGVVMMKPNIAGLLAKLGISSTTLTRGRNAALISSTDSLSAEQLERIKESMDDVYGLFVSRVASGRDMAAEEVDEVGRGRVWTGEQAAQNGLVDELGGILAAINQAKVAVGIDPERRVEVVFYPRARPILERLAEALWIRMAARMPAGWTRLRSLLGTYEFPSGSILTRMPMEIGIR